MFFNFKKKKEIKSSDDLLKALGASDSNDTELAFEFNRLRLLNEPNHNYVNSLDQTNAKLITNSYEYRFEGINKYLQKEYKIKKLKYLLWLKVINEKAIGSFGSRNVHINLHYLFPQMTFNLHVKEEISNEIITQFKKNKKINFNFGLIKYNEENCKVFKQNYYEGAEHQSLIITRFKIY